MKYIRLYVDHPRIGCGNRIFLVLKTGRVWAHLIAAGTAELIKVPVGDLRWAKPLPFKPGRAVKRLRAVAKTYGVETDAVREAITMLKSA